MIGVYLRRHGASEDDGHGDAFGAVSWFGAIARPRARAG
jgi:hypothetical protein